MKTMKFFSMAALALMGAVMIGCTNDDNIIDEPQQPVVTNYSVTKTLKVSLDGGEAGARGITRALTSGGEKTFATGDKLAVIYMNEGGTMTKVETEELKASDISGDGKTATFTVTLTEAPLAGNIPLTYIYPASIATSDGYVDNSQLSSQDGTLASLASNLDACRGYDPEWRSSGDLPALTLTNAFTIGKFTIKNPSGTAINDKLTSVTISDGANTYTITPTGSTFTSDPIWVAMQPVTTGDITIYAAKGKELYKKTVSGKTLDAGKLYPINVTTTKVDGAISGLFTVNSSGKKVYFSQGNLQATTTDSWSTWTFSFMDYQYSTVETNADPYCTANYGDKTVVSLFGWGTSGYDHRTLYWQPYSTTKNSDYYGAYSSLYYDLNQAGQNGKADWGYNAISNGGNTENSGWRTMTSDEWSYLLTNHTRGWASVNGVSGLVIRPYGVSTAVAASYDAEAWAVEEAAGAVFLPAAGVRVGKDDAQKKSYVRSVGTYAFYWTATHYDNSGNHNAYRTDISSSGVTVTYNANPACGNAVRLVKDVN